MWLLFKERRQKKRYAVSWAATMAIRYTPEDVSHMEVTVSSISPVGALINAHYMDVDGRHIIMADQHLEHYLVIERPEGAFWSKIKILCYDWSHKDNIYQIRIEFIETSNSCLKLIKNICKKLKKQKA